MASCLSMISIQAFVGVAPNADEACFPVEN
jgi:hypothetical protein